MSDKKVIEITNNCIKIQIAKDQEKRGVLTTYEIYLSVSGDAKWTILNLKLLKFAL